MVSPLRKDTYASDFIPEKVTLKSTKTKTGLLTCFSHCTLTGLSLLNCLSLVTDLQTLTREWGEIVNVKSFDMRTLVCAALSMTESQHATCKT